MDGKKILIGIALLALSSGAVFAHGVGMGAGMGTGHGPMGLCQNGSITDDARELFEQARADNDTETAKSILEEYCPMPQGMRAGPNATCEGARANVMDDIASAIDDIRELVSSGDYDGAKTALDGLRDMMTTLRTSGPAHACHGGPMGPPPEGAGPELPEDS